MRICKGWLLFALLVTASTSCGGTNDDTPEAAIDKIANAMIASILSGGPTIDKSLYAAPPTAEQSSNPVSPPPDSSSTATLGDGKDDGTKGMKVTIANSFTKDATGRGTISTTVTETDTGFKFLDYKATVAQPKISYRIPSYGLKALKPDGTGQAFVVVTVESSGAVTRTYTNVNPANNHQLVNFGSNPVPSGTASGTGAGKTEFVGDIILTRVNGKLVGKIGAQGTGASSSIYFSRDGGTAQSALAVGLSAIQVGSSAVAATGDLYVALGSDVPGGLTDAMPMASMMVTLSGAAAGQMVQGSVSGPWKDMGGMGGGMGPGVQSITASASFSHVLDAIDGLGDGTVELDPSLAAGFQVGDPRPNLDVSLSQDAFVAQDLVSAAYLGSFAMGQRSVVLLH
jgi:hypothetical protein